MATDPRPLLLISGGPSTRALWPGLAEHYDLVFLYPQAGQEAKELGLRAAALAELVDPDLQESIQNQAALLTARVVGRLPELSERFHAAFGQDGPPALNGRLGDWFAGYAHYLLQGEVAILAQLERLAGQGRVIAGCLTHEDVAPDTRAMVAWANQRGIPTLHVPHAPCHLTTPAPDIHKETRATFIAASGPQVARFYQDCGVPAERITLTGGPQWDELYDGAMPGREEARRVAVPDWKAGPILVYMSTWGQTTSLRSNFDAEFNEGWQATLAAAKALGAFLCVLVHWNDQRADTEDAYAKALDAAGVDGLVTRAHKSYILRAADLLIAQGPSNMCIDAAIAGTPSVYLQTEGFDYATALPRRCLPADLLGELTGALGHPAPADEWSDFISQYNSAHPTGAAAERVVDWVRQLCP